MNRFQWPQKLRTWSKFTHEMDELVPRYVLHNLANISHRMPGSNMIHVVISQKSRFRINLNFGHLIINIGQIMSNTLAPEYQAPKHELPCRCNFVWPKFSDFERFESVKMSQRKSQRKSQLMNQIRQATSSEATPPLEDTSHSHDRC